MIPLLYQWQLYQQANNHWLRKLAHGRGLYLIPTGDIAAVVFAAEFFSQLRNRGIDLRPRLPGFPGQGQTGWKDTGQNLEHQICGTAHCRARSRMASTSFHRPRFPAQNHSLPKSVGRITPTTRRRPFRDVTTHLHPMVSPLSTPASPENPRSKRHDTTIFVERLQNRSSSSVVPTSNPPTLTPAVPNPEARPKKSSRPLCPSSSRKCTHWDRDSSGHAVGSAEEDDDSATDHGLPINRSSTSATAPAPTPADPIGPLREPDHEPPVPHPEINIDDNEFIGHKLDTRSRPSWKTIGQRMRRTAGSCKARWQWLKNTRPDLLTRADNNAETRFSTYRKSLLLLHASVSCVSLLFDSALLFLCIYHSVTVGS